MTNATEPIKTMRFTLPLPRQTGSGRRTSQLRQNGGRLPLPGFRARCLLEKDRGLVHGFSPANRELVVDALEMAVCRRKPAAGLVHHSDRGTQYTALSFGKRLEEAGIVPSMGRAGSALDNAISESFVSTLKCELVHRRPFPTREAAILAWLHESGELRRSRDEGGGCSVAKTCPPNRCNSSTWG